MGVIDAIARSAARCAHVLPVEVPGHWRIRARVERALLTRGWRLASSPADADVLAVCGEPGPRLDEAVEQAWHQMPGPRVRVDVRRREDVERRLDEASSVLLDTVRHRHDADTRPTAAELLERGDRMGHGGMAHDGAGHDDHGDDDHGDHGHGDHGHGNHGHGNHGHGDMDMSPGGIPLAEADEDRDGLELDVLNVRLGPVLQYWPAGLVLRGALHGDLIAAAQADVLETETQTEHAGYVTERARTLDSIVSLLTLAGWDDAAAGARHIRDARLEGHDGAATASRLRRLRRTVTRSRVLRWSLRGIRPLDREDLEHHDLPAHLGGDTYTRLLGMLERADGEGRPPQAFPLARLPRLTTGLDVATARLVIASLDIHGLDPEPARHRESHA